MEQQNPPEFGKRLWSIVRIMYYMLRRGIISKGKFMDDANTMIRRGKTVRKAICNIMFHYSSSSQSASSTTTFVAPKDYEFSCSNTPAFFFPFSIKKKKTRSNHSSLLFGCAFAPETIEDDRDAVVAVKNILEMLKSNEETIVESCSTLPGFSPSPAVRQLRVTDSPFPLHGIDEDNRVDERAEKFIARFYSELWRQRIMDSPGPW